MAAQIICGAECIARCVLLSWRRSLLSLVDRFCSTVEGPMPIGSASSNSNGMASEESKVVVVENGKMVDIQDKEVSMEGLCSISTYDQWSWLSVSGQLPKPRYKHGAAVVQQKMYVFGGNHNGRYLGDIQVLDFKSLFWSKLEAKSQSGPSESAETVSVAACAGHSLIPWGNKILCLAGHTREPTESLIVKVFDPQTCTWSTLRTYGRSPRSRGGQSVTLVGDTLVVFGGEGYGRSLLNDLHILDLETMTWDEFETTGTPPSPRSEHAAACYAERYLLIFGGGSHSTCFNDLHLLDMQTMEWSKPEQQGITPEPRAGHAGVTIGEYWFITAGGNNKKGVSDTLVLNMSTYVWSVVTSLEGRAPPTSEVNSFMLLFCPCKGSSLVLQTINGEDFLVSFGGYSGRYSNEVYALKPSLRPSVPSQQISELETNRIAPISVAATSSKNVIFEIEELQDEKGSNKADISKTLVQAVKGERNQVEDRLNQERLQRLHLKQELADVENRNVELAKELDSVQDQLHAEGARASKLEDEISELQQRLQKMNALEYEFESLHREMDSQSEEAASTSNQPPRVGGFWRWNG
ncbi:acyl-CoA-binding domain-containing protein 6-like isoform X2 [Phragmites australis]|uniref:acyl-CoA-binding domain-containing protein 6-like isoform X2 n=1 Tax=Phragmites australis TaxID=29695 RepID=UPI002D79C32A|nr:acyl-CoA-binding domain-containing protein 6-like isoform X2 [Phragmites australis]